MGTHENPLALAVGDKVSRYASRCVCECARRATRAAAVGTLGHYDQEYLFNMQELLSRFVRSQVCHVVVLTKRRKLNGTRLKALLRWRDGFDRGASDTRTVLVDNQSSAPARDEIVCKRLED